LTIKARAKDLAFKAKARTTDHNFVLQDNQRPKTKAKDDIPYSQVWTLAVTRHGLSDG